MTPKDLFDHLLAHRERITYKRTYEVLFGPVPGSWSQAYGSQVISASLAAGLREAAGLVIGLDALIVSSGTQRPSPGHFRTKDYDEATWIRGFGGWGVCDHR